MFSRLRHILEMIRFSHTLFALPFALLAASLAWRQNLREGRPFRWQELAGILLCMVFARSMAMAFNRLADRGIDAENPRTAGRHLPAGILSVSSVVAFCAVVLPRASSPRRCFSGPTAGHFTLSLPVLAFLCGYSYAKRFTALCHYWLGAALCLSPIAAWIAIRGELAWPPVLLWGAVFFWVGGFDIIYACQDVGFDTERGLLSIPARLGVASALKLASRQPHLMLACLAGLVVDGRSGLGLSRRRRASSPACSPMSTGWFAPTTWRVNLAFFHVNAVISVGLLVVALADMWLGP